MVAHLKVSKSVYFRWKQFLNLPYVSPGHAKNEEKPDYYFSWGRAKLQDFILNKI